MALHPPQHMAYACAIMVLFCAEGVDWVYSGI